MTVTNVVKDRDARTMTITAEFDAPVARVWQLWDDPRQLERWWGPPTYPATFDQHDLRAGGSVSYAMTGPDGDTSRGWWRVLAVDAPHRLEFEDGFADDQGEPNPDMPVMVMRVELSGRGDDGTRMTIETSFPTEEAMDRILTMGMEEGMSAAMGQMDDVLAAQVAS
jgi:uncharacterized protein YndB with AHSA1/START domain